MNFETAVVSSGYERGLDAVRLIQRIASPLLTTVMKLVTNLGSVYAFFAAIMLLYWLVNERKAFRLGLLVILSAWLNLFLKYVFNQPRPFHLDLSLGMIPESGNGFPSGHAQLAVTFLVPLVVWYTKRTAHSKSRLPVFAWTAAVFFILLISFSRLYLGVHFPQDILGGWILGCAAPAVFFAFEKWAIPWLKNEAGKAYNSLRARLAAAALIPLAMNFLYPHDRAPGAVFLGFACGYALMKTYLSFTAKNNRERIPPVAAAAQIAARIFAGFAGAAVLFFGLKFVFPGPDSSLYGLFYFIRYSLLGCWVSFGSPWLFIRMNRV